MFGKKKQKPTSNSWVNEDLYTSFITADEFLEQREAMHDLEFKDLPFVVRKAVSLAHETARNQFNPQVEAYVGDYEEMDKYDLAVYHRIFNDLGWTSYIKGGHGTGYWIILSPHDAPQEDQRYEMFGTVE